jgi:hypothetical protein
MVVLVVDVDVVVGPTLVGTRVDDDTVVVGFSVVVARDRTVVVDRRSTVVVDPARVVTVVEPNVVVGTMVREVDEPLWAAGTCACA